MQLFSLHFQGRGRAGLTVLFFLVLVLVLVLLFRFLVTFDWCGWRGRQEAMRVPGALMVAKRQGSYW